MQKVITAAVKAIILLAAPVIALGCAWLAYSEYQFARYSSDLRVLWWSLVAGSLFLAAVAGGVVGLYRFIVSGRRKGVLSPWEEASLKDLTVVFVLGASAVVCCYLTIGSDVGERVRQLGVIEPGKVTGYFVRGGRTVGVSTVGDRGPTGIPAYLFRLLTGALSSGFTWSVASVLRGPE